MRISLAAITAIILGDLIFSSAAFTAENPPAHRSVAQIKHLLSKKALDSYAQGCRRGQVWCCKPRRKGGAKVCQCQYWCSGNQGG